MRIFLLFLISVKIFWSVHTCNALIVPSTHFTTVGPTSRTKKTATTNPANQLKTMTVAAALSNAEPFCSEGDNDTNYDDELQRRINALPPECHVPTYAIYKPRGVLSRTGIEEMDTTTMNINNDNNEIGTCSSSAPRTTTKQGIQHRRRRTLTDLMVDAGFPPLSKHIGRLDLETSGLILVTADSLLLEASLAMPGATSLWTSQQQQPLPSSSSSSSLVDGGLSKTYELLLAGRYTRDSHILQELTQPLTFNRSGQTVHSKGATVNYQRTFHCPELATEYMLLDCQDEDMDPTDLVFLNNDENKMKQKISCNKNSNTNNTSNTSSNSERNNNSSSAIEQCRAIIRTNRERIRYSRKIPGKRIPTFILHDGWLTSITVTITEGRHHQIRRLCHRSKLRLRHLRRISFGPISLDLPQKQSQPQSQKRRMMIPGDVRELSLLDKYHLYHACVPYLDGAHERRTRAMLIKKNQKKNQTEIKL